MMTVQKDYWKFSLSAVLSQVILQSLAVPSMAAKSVDHIIVEFISNQKRWWKEDEIMYLSLSPYTT